MIKLVIEEYCNNCPDFEPLVDKRGVLNLSVKPFQKHETIISCEHRDRCKAIHDYVLEEILN